MLMKLRRIAFLMLMLPGFLFAEIMLVSGAGYKKPLEEVAKLYEVKSGKKVLRSYGNLQQIIEQAKRSGKVDLIFGDEKIIEKSPLKLETKQLIGQGRLVLVSAKGRDFKSLEDLMKVEKIALPDTKKAIYGIAAQEFLKNANLYEKLKDKLFIFSTVPQVSAYLLKGGVDVGFINISDYLANQDKMGNMVIIDEKFYTPIKISIYKLIDSENKEAKDFIGFLSTKEAKEIFKKYGLYE